MEFMYLFIVALILWGMAILTSVSVKFKFLFLPILALNIGFLIPNIISNAFPEWLPFWIITTLITLLLAIVSAMGD